MILNQIQIQEVNKNIINNNNSEKEIDSQDNKGTLFFKRDMEIKQFFNYKGIILSEKYLPDKDEIIVNDKKFQENLIDVIKFAFNRSNIKFVLFYANYLIDCQVRKVLHYLIEDVHKYYTLTLVNKKFFFICRNSKYIERVTKFNKLSVESYLSSYEISTYDYKNEIIENKKEKLINGTLKKSQIPVISLLRNIKIEVNSIEFDIPEINLTESLMNKQLNFLIYKIDYENKKLSLLKESNNHHIFLENLGENKFITITIIASLKEDNLLGQRSQFFYFFTRSLRENCLYVMGDNHDYTFPIDQNNCNEKEEIFFRSPTKINICGILSFCFNNNLSYITLNTGEVICNSWALKPKIVSTQDNDTIHSYVKLQSSYKLNTTLCIRKVICGRDSMASLTHDGKIYIKGSNLFGQLGLNCPYDTVIYDLKPITFNVGIPIYFVLDAVAGDFHYIALIKTTKLKLFKWGLNQGIEEQPFELESSITIKKNGSQIARIGNSKVPLLMNFENSDYITRIYAKYNVTFLQCLEKFHIDNLYYYKRQVYCFGEVNKLQLGIPDLDTDYLAIPLKIKFFNEFDVINFCVGKYNSLFIVCKDSFDHISKMPEFGMAFGCGLNKNYELGSSMKNILNPIKLIENDNIKAISCGTNFSLLADNDNNLYLLTSKNGKLELEGYDKKYKENIFLNTKFSEAKINVKSIIAEKRKVSFITN